MDTTNKLIEAIESNEISKFSSMEIVAKAMASISLLVVSILIHIGYKILNHFTIRIPEIFPVL